MSRKEGPPLPTAVRQQSVARGKTNADMYRELSAAVNQRGWGKTLSRTIRRRKRLRRHR